MNYEEFLNYQPMLNPKVRETVNLLRTGKLKLSQLSNRKHYARKTGDILSVIEYTTAFEIFNMLRNKNDKDG